MSTYKISRKSEAKNQSAAARSWPKKITNKRRQILKLKMLIQATSAKL